MCNKFKLEYFDLLSYPNRIIELMSKVFYTRQVNTIQTLSVCKEIWHKSDKIFGIKFDFYIKWKSYGTIGKLNLNICLKKMQ